MVGTEQLELDLSFTPEPSPTVTYFDPVLGAVQVPADLYGA